nr:MAG TPA: Gifsy-2 prophage ATP-binding sugar transporter-like barrel, 4 helix bundle.7A [Caudoviricetes sp.]
MKLSFKEMVKKDCKDVFLNPKEFGGLHTVDGRPMVIQIDESEITERSKKQLERAEGVYKRQLLFYVAQEDFGPLPAIGRQIKIDNGSYRVVDANSEGGIYSITVGRNQA